MPKRLPAKDIITGLIKNVFKALKFWLHSTLVAISWLAIVPISACRIYRCLFAGSLSSLLTLPLDMLSTENIIGDILQGSFVVLCSLSAFIGLVWLREQILTGGGPEWLENDANPPRPNHQRPHRQQRQQQQPIQAPRLRPQPVNNNELGLNNDEHIPPNVDNNDQDDGEVDNQNNNQNQNQNQNQNINNNNNQNNNNNNNNINGIEWDRAAEDLTWDRVC
jgi:E3 ubiquitin-protein ligase MARCH6